MDHKLYESSYYPQWNSKSLLMKCEMYIIMEQVFIKCGGSGKTSIYFHQECYLASLAGNVFSSMVNDADVLYVGVMSSHCMVRVF